MSRIENDTANEIIRKSAIKNDDGSYEIKTNVINDDLEPIPIQHEITQSDFRLMLAYQRRMLKELKKLNDYMSLITGDEL